MGNTTDFVGHVDIAPALNSAEATYLEAFRRMRHFDRGGSPYEVPGNPLAPDHEGVPAERYSSTGPGKPQLYCQWAVCGTGCCLAFDGVEKFYAPVEWMRYLIEHLLAPGAAAAQVDHPQLRGFTFDHRLDGVVVGCRRDDRELFAIVVEDNVVTREVLCPGDTGYGTDGPLAYQVTIDEYRERRNRRRRDSPAARARGAKAWVVVLADRASRVGGAIEP